MARKVTIVMAAALLLLLAGCRSAPLVGEAPVPGRVNGTITGTLLVDLTEEPIANRQVAAVDIETGRRHSDLTGPAGNFSMWLPPGTYRLEVDLLPGEEVREEPDPVELEPSELVDELVITVGTGEIAG